VTPARNHHEKWQISGICEAPVIEESSILNVFSLISNCFDIEDDSMIFAVKTYCGLQRPPAPQPLPLPL
jgi:hypothetical protein